MKFGCDLYNFIHYGNDIAGTREFVLTAEKLGYHHVRVLDHVVGLVNDKHGGNIKYHSRTTLREIFTFLGYLSAITERIQLLAAIVVLPMRSAALVAKQAAEVDLLSGGRFILGVGAGYVAPEFEALGASFPDRGRRMEEQIAVMRALWTHESVNFSGEWHTLRDVAVNPLPVRRPIPIWFGLGRTPPDRVLNRIGRLADGWMPPSGFQLDEPGRTTISKVHAFAREAGRNPDDITMMLHFDVGTKDRAQLLDEIRQMRDFGVKHVTVHFPPQSIKDEIEGLKRFRDIADAV